MNHFPKPFRVSRLLGALLLSAFTVLGLASCGSNDPDCASSGSTTLIAQIAMQHQALQMGFLQSHIAEPGFMELLAQQPGLEYLNIPREQIGVEQLAQLYNTGFNDAVYGVSAIRTTSKDASTKAVMCAADLTVSLGKWNTTAPITYKVEITSEDKLYATVWGIQ